MKKNTRKYIFVGALVFNILFFILCGYGRVHQEHTATYLDPFLGAIAVALLAYGEMKLITQIYLRNKYKHLTIRTFDKKFPVQLAAVLVYYVGSLVYLSVALFDFSASYLSIFAMVISPLWLTGSKTLWTGEAGEESYYLDDMAKWYVVSKVTENESVVEITGTPIGDRERTITHFKSKMAEREDRIE